MRRDNIIISPDYDGYLSFFIYKKYFNNNANIFGKYYTYSKNVDGSTSSVLLLKEKEFKKETILSIDLDINYFDSIGHHYLLPTLAKEYSGKHINFNLECENLSFFQKCPFSTVLVLLCYSDEFKKDLRNLFIEKKYNKIAFLLYADNFILLFKKYSSNVKNWMIKKKLEWLYSEINENYYKIIIECEKIRTKLVKDFNFFVTSGFYFPQSVNQNFEKKFINFLSKEFGFNQYFDMNFEFKRYFENVRISLEEAKKYKNIFSHAVINLNTISISVGNI